MKLTLPITALLLLFSFLTHAQTASYTVEGTVVDTASMRNMGYTSISILNRSDSVLQDYGRADEDGHFTLQVKDTGAYILLYAHPVFANFIGELTVKGPHTDMGLIPLISKQNLLEEVIVTDARPITIKGDTVEYAADSFQVRKFATVDELLRKLPGIEVNQKGEITAHGEKVQKMLVDGDEFFADDPAVLSKMLRAAAVDKVQVFNKKSEEAELTGIDDGEPVKTINLTLKEHAKSGYFGKVVLGGGPPRYFENQLMLNAFRKKRKIAAYAITSNTNNVGLGWNDASRFGTGGGFVSMGDDDDDGSMQIYQSDNGISNSNGGFSGEGLPRSINGGLHYDNKFGPKANQELAADYRINSYNLEVAKSTRTQYIMPDTQYVNNHATRNNNNNLFQSLNGRTELNIDSLNSIVVNAKASINKTTGNSHTEANATDMQGNLINDSRSDNEQTSLSYNTGLDMIYRKKSRVKGRSFSASLNGNYTQRNAEGSFISENNFYTTGTSKSYNQRKTDSTQNMQAKVRITYTEPLIKDKLFLILNAYSNYLSNTASNLSFDRVPGTEHDTLNTLYSGNYDYSVWTNAAGATLRFNYEKLKFNFGGNMTYARYKNQNNFTGDTFARNYLNFFPRASVKYSRSRMMSLTLSYNGSTTQPRIEQIQVMVQNTDPLNIRLGNPDLVQSFTHRFSLNFNQYRMLSESYTYGNLGYSFIQNAFGQKQSINTDGVNTYQTVNINGNWNTYGYLGYAFKIKPLDTRLSLGLNGNYGNNNSYLNEVLNRAQNTSIGLRLGLDYYKDSTLELSYSIRPNYNYSKSSVNMRATNEFLMAQQELQFSYTFWKGLELGIHVNWLLRQKVDQQDKNNNVFLANAYLSKALLKNRSLNLRLEGNDLFNQNIGFNRNVYGNTITEATYNNIRRYAMLKLTWNFTYSKALSDKQEEHPTDEINLEQP